MKNLVIGILPVVAMGILGSTGCSSASAPEASIAPVSDHVVVNDTPVSTETGTVLATITSGSHTFSFGRAIDGDVVVSEMFPSGEKSAFADGALRGSVADVYTALSNGGPVPAPLLEVRAASAQTPIAAPPAAKREEKSDSLIRVNPWTSGQTWFYDNYCLPGYICNIGSGPLNASQGEYIYASNYFAHGYNDASNTSTAVALAYVWNGSSWQYHWLSAPISPGYTYYEFWYNSAPVYRSSELAVTGPGGIVMDGISPTDLVVTYTVPEEFNIAVGNGQTFNKQWPNDARLTCTISDGTVTVTLENGLDTVGSALNVNLAGICANQGMAEGPLSQTACCTGQTTGQSTCVNVTNGYGYTYFVPEYCCASIGGRSQC